MTKNRFAGTLGQIPLRFNPESLTLSGYDATQNSLSSTVTKGSSLKSNSNYKLKSKENAAKSRIQRTSGLPQSAEDVTQSTQSSLVIKASSVKPNSNYRLNSKQHAAKSSFQRTSGLPQSAEGVTQCTQSSLVIKASSVKSNSSYKFNSKQQAENRSCLTMSGCPHSTETSESVLLPKGAVPLTRKAKTHLVQKHKSQTSPSNGVLSDSGTMTPAVVAPIHHDHLNRAE